MNIHLGRTVLDRIDADMVRAGTQLQLVRDYGSLINRNGVPVATNGTWLGYIPWELAEVIAVDLDAGYGLTPHVAAFDQPAGVVQVTIGQT